MSTLKSTHDTEIMHHLLTSVQLHETRKRRAIGSDGIMSNKSLTKLVNLHHNKPDNRCIDRELEGWL